MAAFEAARFNHSRTSPRRGFAELLLLDQCNKKNVVMKPLPLFPFENRRIVFVAEDDPVKFFEFPHTVYRNTQFLGLKRP